MTTLQHFFFPPFSPLEVVEGPPVGRGVTFRNEWVTRVFHTTLLFSFFLSLFFSFLRLSHPVATYRCSCTGVQLDSTPIGLSPLQGSPYIGDFELRKTVQVAKLPWWRDLRVSWGIARHVLSTFPTLPFHFLIERSSSERRVTLDKDLAKSPGRS